MLNFNPKPMAGVEGIKCASLRPQILGNGYRDYKSAAVTAVTIALAVLLGWMMGRAGWNAAVDRAQSQTATVPENWQDPAEITSDILPTSSVAEEATSPVKQVQSSPNSAFPSNADPKPKVDVTEPHGGLVVYGQGKTAFRAEPREKTSTSVKAADPAQTELTGNSPASPSQGSPEATDRLLITRVEPAYPEEARQQHIQGPVVMKVVVGTDGSVQDLIAISGDPQLAKAAAKALRQWRFQPHRLDDKPVEFETRITIVFTLR
jgi:TonB family protein